jgi:ABC-2 type transport system permease protein
VKNTLIGEWIKFRTIRSTKWTVVALAALPVGVAVLVALTKSLAPDDTVLAGALGNAVVGLVPAGILGALLAAGEHGVGTIRLTLAAVPLRWPVPAAKAMLAAGLAFVVSLLANGVGFVVAAALLPDHRPGSSLPALVGVAFVYAAVAVLGVALGTALRNPAGAVIALTGILLAPALLGPLLGRVQWLATLTPFGAAQKVLLPASGPGVASEGPGAWPSVVLVCLGCAAGLGAATWLLLRRDA